MWLLCGKNWCFLTMVLEKTLESPLDSKEIQPVNPKKISFEYSLERLIWSWSSNILATWCNEMILWKRTWCWVRLKVGGEGDDRRWDGWTASPTKWTWVWASSGSWWWTGKPGVLQSMGSLQSPTRLSDWTELSGFSQAPRSLSHPRSDPQPPLIPSPGEKLSPLALLTFLWPSSPLPNWSHFPSTRASTWIFSLNPIRTFDFSTSASLPHQSP